MKIVLDTNVLVSGLLSPFGTPAQILQLIIAGELILCYDSRILSEYRKVLQRPKFQFDLTKILDLLDFIEQQGILTSAIPLAKSLPDSADNAFLEVAVADNVLCLITGNTKHYPLELCKGVKIFNPSQFIEFYRKEKQTLK